MRSTLKVMPPILLCWPVMSEVDVGGMAVQVEPSHQYSVTFRYRVTDGSRGAAWHNGIWYRSVYEANVCYWIPPCRKNGTHWHSLMLAEDSRKTKSGCEHSEAVYGQTPWNSGSPPLVKIFTSGTWRLLFIAGKNAQLIVIAAKKITFHSWEFAL